MNEEERALQSFLDDLVAVCQKHGMAVFNQDEYGIALIRWGGWVDDRKVNPIVLSGPLLQLHHITPDGGEEATFEVKGYL
jgi:hypothetical protein